MARSDEAKSEAQVETSLSNELSQTIGPERWKQIKDLLDAVVDLPIAQQRTAIASACGEDSELERQVLSFLELDSDEFIEDPLWTLHRGAPSDAPRLDIVAGRRIGPYRLERLLGRGGMGAVFLAKREDDFHQQVALKLVSFGSESDEILARFYNERQILARLQHPNIARLLDGGTTEDGRPYFVMEYVEGEPIDLYCDRRDLPVRQRLELFQRVCSAIHFAHQNLVVHRDLKASNILVTPSGQPRLLDFGIAKLLAPQLAARPLTTAPGQVPMTPAYASPEQALGQPVTTATDVYALGVLLYRLLAGRLPFEVDGRGYAEIVHAICFEEPTKPSQQTTAAKSDEPTSTPAGSTRRRSRQLAGDLDAIVLQAMRKEPQNRYGSAAEMADDVGRHLEGLPVKARRGTGIYNLTKFMRRNKLALAVMVLVAAFAVAATILWQLAVHERNIAEQERERSLRAQARSERMNTFLEDLFEAAEPDRARGRDPRVSEILESGRERIVESLDTEPEVKAEMLGTLGTVYQKLGRFDQARTLKEEALEQRRVASSEASEDLAKDLNNLASLLYSTGDYGEAERRFREVLEMQRSIATPEAQVARTQHNLASTLMQQGKFAKAETHFREALEARQRLYGDDSRQVASSLYSLGALASNRGDFEAAEPLLRQALAIRQRVYGFEDTRVAAVLGSLGWLLRARGDYAGAREAYEHVLAIRSHRLAPDHPSLASTKKNLAAVLLDQGDVETAGVLLSEALGVLRKTAAPDSWKLADANSLWGVYLTQQNNFAAAEPILLSSLRTIREIRGESSADTRQAAARVVALYDAWGRPERASEFDALLGD